MPKFNYSFKTLAKVGAGATAIIAIATVISTIRPFLTSDAPPLAGVSRVIAVDAKTVTLAQNIQEMQRHQDQSDQTILFLNQGWWTKQLIDAQAAVRQDPNNLIAQQQVIVARQQLNSIQQQLLAISKRL